MLLNKYSILIVVIVLFKIKNCTIFDYTDQQHKVNDSEEEYSLDDLSPKDSQQKQLQQEQETFYLNGLMTEANKKPLNNKTDNKNKTYKYLFKSNTEGNELRQKLNNLLAYSIATRAEELSLINHPEKEREFKSLIIEKPKQEKILGTYGSKACSLTSLAVSANKGSNNYLDNSTPDVKICPWHYEFSYRADRYPHLRLNARCNCENCLAKTVFDTNDKERYSYCKPVRILMPVLVRKQSVNNIQQNSDNFNWEFRMEPVTNSCVCTLNLKPF